MDPERRNVGLRGRVFARFASRLDPLLPMILRGPLHGLCSDRILLLSYVGRRSGRRFALPVGYAELGDDVTIESGFDQRAGELAEAAASAVEVAFEAEAMMARDANADRMRARMHGAVEKQIDADDPPQVRQTLERLVSEGMSRDAAVHAIAGVFMHLMHQVLVTGKPFDGTAYAIALGAIQSS